MDTKELYLLHIIPIDDSTATLHSIEGKPISVGVFSTIGTYEGARYYGTPEELQIVSGFYQDKEYTITSIDGMTFSHCRNLKKIFIGKCVAKIDWNMYMCDSLQNIIVDKDNSIYHDVDGVLFKGKELVAFPQGRKGEYKIPNGTKSIGKYAFKSSHISKVVFPDTLESIGTNAFYECREIEYFDLPASIKKVASINNIGSQPILQKFYLQGDVNHTNPLTIEEIRKLFPA
jgi:hypothetical protein